MATKTYAIPQGKFVFKAKENEAGEKALYLQYVIDSTPVYRTTGIFVKEVCWDKKKQCIKSGASAARTNNELQAKKRKVDTQIADLLHDGGILTKEIVKQMLEGSYAPADNAKKTDLVEYALEYNERRYLAKEITEKTRYNHEKVLKAFALYLKNELGTPSISLAQVSVELLDKFKISGKLNSRGVNVAMTVNVDCCDIHNKTSGRPMDDRKTFHRDLC